MKIAIINSTYGTGSIGRLAKGISDFLLLRGHSVAYFYAQGTDHRNLINDKVHGSCAGKLYMKKISSRNEQRIHALLSRITGLQGYFSVFRTIQLIRDVDAFKPDVVHLHNLHSNYINLYILARYLKKNDVSTVITLHDCWFYTGKCTYYVPAQCEKWMNGCGNCPLLHKDNVNPTFFLDTTHRCIKDKEKWFSTLKRLAIVGVSDWVTNEARKSIYKDKMICRIYNWIDQDVFFDRGRTQKARLGLRENLNLPKDRKIILTVAANLSEKKGYRELLYLAENMSNNYQLVYIGRNKQKLAIPENVIHIEHTDSADQMAEYYSASDVCVNTTQYETFGMVTVESMSCGTPVIVYNNTASSELVGECGVLVEQKDGMHKIIEAVEKIVSWDCESTRERCAKYARSRFCRDESIVHYLNLYERLQH